MFVGAVQFRTAPTVHFSKKKKIKFTIQIWPEHIFFMHNSIMTYLLLRLYWNSMTIHIYLYQIITNIPWQYTMQIIVLAVHLNYETADRYMKSNVKTNLHSMQVTQERTRHTQADWTESAAETGTYSSMSM